MRLHNDCLRISVAGCPYFPHADAYFCRKQTDSHHVNTFALNDILRNRHVEFTGELTLETRLILYTSMGDPWRPESRGTAHGRNRQVSKPPVVWPGEAVAFLEGSEFAASFTVHPGKPAEVHRASGPAPVQGCPKLMIMGRWKQHGVHP